MIKSLEDTRAWCDKINQTTAVEVLKKYLDAIEREVRDNYIELPKDADGEYIRVGDELEGKKIGGGWCDPFEVTRMSIDIGGWYVYRRGNCGHTPHLCRHHKPSTVEDVLREFALEVDPGADVDVSGAEVIAKFAKRLQLKEEAK